MKTNLVNGAAMLAGALALSAAPASAHLGLESPASRYGSGVLKEGPCGMTGGLRSDNVTVFEPGQTIEVVWTEYIDHPGHYRIAFDPDGDDDLTDPACVSGCETRTPEIEQNTAGVMVLLDGIADRRSSAGDSTYTATITLPDVECDNCTLQVIQVMYDKPPQTRPGNDIYYQCADVILQNGGANDAGVAPDTDAGPPAPGVDAGPPTPGQDAGPPTPGVDAGPPSTVEGGCSCRAGGAPFTSHLAWLALASLLLFRRRR